MNAPSQEASADPALRSEIERLGEELAVRRSVTHYAVAFVGSVVGVVAFGVSMRLLIDSARLPHVFWGTAALTLFCVALSIRGFFRGNRLRRCEHERFQQYLALRSKAGIDQALGPSLPRPPRL